MIMRTHTGMNYWFTVRIRGGLFCMFSKLNKRTNWYYRHDFKHMRHFCYSV